MAEEDCELDIPHTSHFKSPGWIGDIFVIPSGRNEQDVREVDQEGNAD